MSYRLLNVCLFYLINIIGMFNNWPLASSHFAEVVPGQSSFSAVNSWAWLPQG